MARTFILPHATVHLTSWGVRTEFRDGVILQAVPEDNDGYRARAREFGYGYNVLELCQEHELAHNILSELLHGGPSPTLWAVAHPDDPRNIPRRLQGLEESLVLALQRWINQHPRSVWPHHPRSAGE